MGILEFRIADTLTDSLARLSGDEQKLVEMINRLGDEVMKVFKV